MLLYEMQHRGLGQAYAGIVRVDWRGTLFTLVLQRHPTGTFPWGTSLYDTRELTPTSTPTWSSTTYMDPNQALTALREHLASLDLPDELEPLVHALLPPVAIGIPRYDLA